MGMLEEGYQCLYEFSQNPALKIYQIEVTPPSLDGGGPIDETTQHNEEVTTQSPKTLKRIGQAKITCGYEGLTFSEVWALLNQNGVITCTFPDGKGFEQWGWIDKFTPTGMSEGNRPTAEVIIEWSNHDDNGVEVPPTFF